MVRWHRACSVSYTHLDVYKRQVLVVCLNFSMMSDRVLWGDEAFSANTAHKDVDGILQVLYYWTIIRHCIITG